MISPVDAFEEPARRLIDALQQELELLDRKTGQMDRLREAVIDSDDAALESLIDDIAQCDVEQSRLDTSVTALGQTLSRAIDPDGPVMKLGALSGHLGDPQKQQLEDCRREILLRGRVLRRRHLEVAMLLGQCARINSLLLEGMLRGGRPVETYDAQGGRHRQFEGGLMSTER